MTFAEFYNTHPGRKSDKGKQHSYIEGWYSQEFTDRKDDEMTIVEIGVFKGDSLRLFQDWFTNSLVIGIDPKPKWESKVGQGAEGLRNLIVDDAYSDKVIDTFKDKSLDYIIDDGPHTLNSQLECIKKWTPKLKMGGKLIIEDVQDISKDYQTFVSAAIQAGLSSEVIDLRDAKGRYDDVLMVMEKVKSLDSLNSPDVVCVVGRGHSGTRLPAELLMKNGVFMGAPLNKSMDLIGTHQVYYGLCRDAGSRVFHVEGAKWDTSRLVLGDLPENFDSSLEKYLASLITAEGKRGWKMPESSLIYPWLARRFPEMKFVYWVRDPRDVIQGPHITDIIASFDVPAPMLNDHRWNRVMSWMYQYQLFRDTPKPKNLLTLRYEDYMTSPRATAEKLGEFMGIEIRTLVPARVERSKLWKKLDPKDYSYNELKEPLHYLGYEEAEPVVLQV